MFCFGCSVALSNLSLNVDVSRNSCTFCLYLVTVLGSLLWIPHFMSRFEDCEQSLLSAFDMSMSMKTGQWSESANSKKLSMPAAVMCSWSSRDTSM